MKRISPVQSEKLYWIHITVASIYLSQLILIYPQIRRANQPQNHFVDVAGALFSYHALTFFHHASHIIPDIFERYKENLAAHRNPSRWIHFGISSCMIVSILAMLKGVNIGFQLFSLNIWTFLGILLGVIVEFKSIERKLRIIAHFFGWGCFIYVFAVLLSNSNSREYEIIVLGTAILFTLFGLIQLADLIHFSLWKSYFVVEISYIWMSLIAKTIIGFQFLYIARKEKF